VTFEKHYRNARINNTIYSGMASDIYEEMELFDDEFYIEPSLDNEESFRKKRRTFIKKQDRRHGHSSSKSSIYS